MHRIKLRILGLVLKTEHSIRNRQGWGQERSRPTFYEGKIPMGHHMKNAPPRIIEQRAIRSLDDLADWAERQETMLYAHDRKLILDFVKLISDLRITRRKEFRDEVKRASRAVDTGRGQATNA